MSSSILEKAIKKALNNGWDPPIKAPEKWLASRLTLNDLILDKSFAKALWPGELPVTTRLPSWAEPTPVWRHHLQQMIIDKDPIKYLGENL